MSRTAVLLCSGSGVDARALPGATVVADLCERPAVAAAALREADVDRVVVGLCEPRASGELAAALRRAGAAPFGVEAVALTGRTPDEGALLLAAARARVDALPPGERGRPTLNGGAISRRSLFSRGGTLAQAPVAALDEPACAGTAACALCVGDCPTHAIAATRPVPTIDPGACTACGLCVRHCPDGALRLTGAAPAQIEAQLEQLVPHVEGIVFACAAAHAEAAPGWALVELPTLRLLTAGWLLQMRARGSQVRLAPCASACCDGAAAVEEFAHRVPGNGTRRRTPRDRVRLTEPLATVEALAHLAPPGSTAVIEADESPLGLLSLDIERCTLCSACATACPTKALELAETTEEAVLQLRVPACVACGRCVSTCPEKALTVRPGIDLAGIAQGVVVLARAPHETCSGCGVELPPSSMRRRVRKLLPELADAPIELCTRCAIGR